MDLKKFEKHINRSFEDYHPNTDDGKIWSNIKDHIPNDTSDSRYPLFPILLGLLVVTIVGSSLYLISPSETSIPSSAKTNTQALNNLSINQVEEDLQNRQIDLPLNKSSNAKLTSLNRKTNADTPITVNASYSKKLDTEKGKTQIQNQTQKSDDIYYRNFNKDNTVIDLKDKRKSSKDNTKIGASDSNSNKFASESKNLNSQNDGLDAIFSIKPKALLWENNPDNYQPNIYGKSQILTKANSKYFISLNGGVYAPQINYLPSMSTELLDLRQEVESPFEMIQASLLVGRELTSGISIETGINIWQYNWQSINTNSRIEAVQGNFSTSTRETIVSARRINRSRFISIPLSVNYVKPLSRRISLSIGVGYEFGIASNNNGFESDLFGEYDLSSDIEDRYRDRGSNFLLGQIGLDYNISPSTIIKFSVQSKNGNGIFQNLGVDVRRSHQFYGINLGIQKNINQKKKY